MRKNRYQVLTPKEFYACQAVLDNLQLCISLISYFYRDFILIQQLQLPIPYMLHVGDGIAHQVIIQ